MTKTTIPITHIPITTSKEITKMANTCKYSSKNLKHVAFTGLGSLVKLLPTGTVFIFQFLNPVLTNNGKCHPINKYLSGALITFCGLSCFLTTFTDSYIGSDKITHYAIATFKGMWPSPASDCIDLSRYKIKFGDFVHGFFSLAVFAALSLLDSDTVECFYPSFVSSEKVLLMIVPPVIGAISGTVFMLYPNNRHGIGYPSTRPASDNNDDST